jgi:TonB-linked SusC/RagA family outer membrane protein
MRNVKTICYTQALIVCVIAFCSGTAHSQTGYAYAERKKFSALNKEEGNERLENVQKQKLFTVLKQLNESKGIYFLFSEQSLADKMVNPVETSGDDIEKILTQVLKNTGLKFKKVNDKTFVILSKDNSSKKEALDAKAMDLTLINEVVTAEGSQRQASFEIITGKVVGADGAPMPGISITVKGTRRGTSTKADGSFAIDVNKGEVLVISSIGFITQEIAVGDQTNIAITLLEENKQLNEVVVTAMGIKKQNRVLGYSTTQVDGSKFTMSREPNLGNALTGQIAGVSVAGVATGPYGSSRVIIRGNASLTGNNQPLYVIDGIPYDNTNQGSAGMWGGQDLGDGLSNINPDDIENVQVLKSVAATALYGYRGGNGAILITTKSGARSHGIGVEVNNNLTFSNVVDDKDYQYVYGQGTQGIKPTTVDAANATAESAWGAKIDGSNAVNILGDTYAYNAVKNNFKNFYQTGVNNQTSVALLGGNEKGHFRLGLSNLYIKTNVPNSNMKQQGVNFNSVYNISNKLQMNLTANYIFEEVKNRVSFSDAPGNIVASTMFLPSTFDIRWLENRVNPDKSELLPGNQDIYFENPYFIAYDFQNSSNRNRFTGGLTLKYNLLDWLYVQGQLTRDGYTFATKSIIPNGVQYSNAGGGSISMSEINWHELNGNVSVGANKKFGNDFSVNANIGVNSQDDIWKSYSGGGGPFVIPYFYSINNVSSKPFNYGFTHYRVNSVYGSADIGFRNYLFLTVTARNDWFSMLNPETNNYLYPSISSSFVFSDLFTLPSWISFGKFRASYAESSNSGAAKPYGTVLTYGLQGYTLNGQSLGYVNGSSIPNQFLKPVNIKEYEFGLNMDFANSRIGFDIAVYNKKTTNDIVPVTVTNTSGYSSNTINIGKSQNKGIELLLTGVPVKTKDFTWNVSFNYTHNNSKVLDLGGAAALSLDVPRFGDGVSISNIVGLPYGQITGYKYKRDASGNIIYGTDGLPLRSDKPEALGSGVYTDYGGLNNELHYKNFAFSFLIDYKFGAKIYSGTNLVLYSEGLQKNTLQGREGGYIGPGVDENGHANSVAVPAETYFNQLAFGNNIAEEFVYDASFVKLRSVALGYTLPNSILKSGFIKAVSLNLVARNLWTIVKHTPNIDPEANYNNGNAQGLELSGYPAVRSYGLNVNVKF